MLLPDATADDVCSAQWLANGLAAVDGTTIGFRVQALVLEHRDKIVVVDPCVGNHKSLALPLWNQLDLPFLDDFEAAGFDPAAVDMVVHTHLHEDHVGWDTRLVDGSWVPTFVNATHVYVGDELDYTKQEDRREGQDPWADSVEPILDAGLAQEVTAGHDLGDGLRLLATPGHTPGHASLAVESGADLIVITGDVIDHQFQCAAPHLAHGSDWNPAQATETRRALLDHVSHTGAVVVGTHFPTAPVGRVQPHAGVWRFEPLAPGEI